MKLFELEIRPEQEKDFPRSIMPQIRKENLLKSPFSFQKLKIKLDKLKPVQSQRVKGMHDKAKQGYADGSMRPIIIDNDNFIVNGHHRYDVACGLELKKVRVLKVDATIEELIKYFSDTSSPEPTYEQKMKAKLDGLMETIEASQDISALMKGIEADLKQREKDLKKLPKKSIYDEDVVDGNFPKQQRDREMQQGIERELKMYKVLERLAQMWWNNDEDPAVEQKLADMGWEVGEDEGSDTPSVFVIEIGDENGNSYISWPIEQLEKDVVENFKDGKKPGRKGLAKRSGVNTKASVSSLRKTAKNSTGEKQRMAHWMANMKAGRKKSK